MDHLSADGIHAVDNLRFLCSGEVERVQSCSCSHYWEEPFANFATAIIEFSTGAVGRLDFSRVAGRRIFRAEIHSRDITAYVDADRESYIVADDGEPEVFPSSSFGEQLGGQPYHWLGLWHTHRHFLDCLKEHRQPPSSFQGVVKTRELVDRIAQVG